MTYSKPELLPVAVALEAIRGNKNSIVQDGRLSDSWGTDVDE